MRGRTGPLLLFLACLVVGSTGAAAQAERQLPEQLKSKHGHMFMTRSSSKLKGGYRIPPGPPDQPILATGTTAADGQHHVPFKLDNKGEMTKSASKTQRPASFIVQVASQPAAEAMAQGAATQPVRVANQRAQAMAEAVVSEVDRVAATAGVADRVVHTYTHALAGFLVKGPTPTQLRALLNDPSVVAVWPNRMLKQATFSTPEFLGLNSPGGPDPHGGWKQSATRPRQLAGSMHAMGSPPVKAVRNAYDEFVGPNADDWMAEASFAPEEWEERDPNRKHGGSYDDDLRPGGDEADYRPRQRPSVWDQLGGVVGPKGAGEDIVVGVIDDGLWLPDHPSFADTDYWATSHGNTGQVYTKLKNWNGTCQPSDDASTFPCNNKVIGCSWFNTEYMESLLEEWPNEILGCTSIGGHGTHTASTAAGNFGIQAPYMPQDALLSGMAPRARIVVYKVCWGDGTCPESDVLAAYDKAITEGVDVINFSIGGGDDDINSPSALAQMYAAAAGIFVAAAAGNEGPAAGTLNNISPWVTTVAASYHSRSITCVVSFGYDSSAQITRVKGTTNPDHARIGPAPLIYGADAAVSGIAASTAASCGRGTLEPLLVTGAIVICDYDNDGLTNKIVEVQRAGGVAVLVAYVKDTVLYDDRAFLSTLAYINLGVKERDVAIAYARKVGKGTPKAAISAPKFTYDNTAPRMALFSSRGPTISRGYLDFFIDRPGLGVLPLLKPDITAPGVAIAAAISPTSPVLMSPGALYDFERGTSMSTPHIAGIAALIRQKHPSLSPMAVKSTIMTTAYQLTRTGKTGEPFGTPLDYGAGHVDPPAALDPGLVFDSNFADWKAWLCGLDPSVSLCDNLNRTTQATVARQRRITPKSANDPASNTVCTKVDDLNSPSISGITSGALRVKRTLTAVLDDSPSPDPVLFESWAGADAGSCFDIQVWPQDFQLADGESVDVWITITPTPDTNLSTPQFGQVVWRSRYGHRVAIPVAMTFEAFTSPDVLDVDIASFTTEPTYRTSYPISSARSVEVALLADFQPATIMSEPMALASTTTVAFTFTLPPGRLLGVARLYGQDYDIFTDLEMDVYKKQADGTFWLVGSSTSFTSDEAVTFVGAGEYKVVVREYIFSFTTPDNVYLYLWALAMDGSNAHDLMIVAPPRLALSPSNPCAPQVTLAITGVEATADGGLPNRYMGVVVYTNAATRQALGATYVSVA